MVPSNGVLSIAASRTASHWRLGDLTLPLRAGRRPQQMIIGDVKPLDITCEIAFGREYKSTRLLISILSFSSPELLCVSSNLKTGMAPTNCCRKPPSIFVQSIRLDLKRITNVKRHNVLGDNVQHLQ
jgi:hypothetical protein